MHRLLNFLYSGLMVGLGLGTVFQLAILPVVGMRAFDDWTGLLAWGVGISIVTGLVSGFSFWLLNTVMERQGK